MGRRKKYKTEEERVEARKKRQMAYYWRNQEKLKRKNLERYYENKKEKS